MSTHAGVFPFAPLGQVLERRFPEIADGNSYSPAGDLTRAADLLGITRETLCRWRNGQNLTLRAADHCAIRLGLHPTVIWFDFDDLCDRLDADAIKQTRRTRANVRAYRAQQKQLARAAKAS